MKRPGTSSRQPSNPWIRPPAPFSYVSTARRNASNGIHDRPAAILPRLDRLVREVVRLFRRAQLTPDEARYVYQRARR